MNKWNTSDGENSSEEYLQNITQFIEEHLGMYWKLYPGDTQFLLKYKMILSIQSVLWYKNTQPLTNSYFQGPHMLTMKPWYL